MLVRPGQAPGSIFLLIGVASVFLRLMPGTIFIILGIGQLEAEHELVTIDRKPVRHRVQLPQRKRGEEK